jgi:hypothetical protein
MTVANLVALFELKRLTGLDWDTILAAYNEVGRCFTRALGRLLTV